MPKNIGLTLVATDSRPFSRIPIPVKQMRYARLYPHNATAADYGIGAPGDILPPITPNYDATEVVLRTGTAFVVLQSKDEIQAALHTNKRNLHCSPEVMERLTAQIEALQNMPRSKASSNPRPGIAPISASL